MGCFSFYSKMDESQIYFQAITWGRQNYPYAPDIHHNAFVSLIQFVCTGRNRMSVIKTMRTLVAMDIFYLNNSKPLSFYEAIDMFKNTCYGDITIAHAQKWKHDRPERDYKEDVYKAKELISILPSEVIYGGTRDQ